MALTASPRRFISLWHIIQSGPGVLPVQVALDSSTVINAATQAGLLTIIALAFSHLLGSAGVPFLGNRIPALVGGFTVSAVTLRLLLIAASYSGLGVIDFWTRDGWVYNNKDNVAVLNVVLSSNPALSVGVLIFSLVAAMILGGASGWLLARVALPLPPIYMMMSTIALSDIGCVYFRDNIWLAGGTLGVWLPDPLAFLGGDRSVAILAVIILVAAAVYLTVGKVGRSRWGAIVEAVGENPSAMRSLGVDVVAVRGSAVFASSALMALAGSLYAFATLYINEAPYHNSWWTFWPILIVMMGGLGSRTGAVVGVALVTAMRYAIIVYRFELQALVFFPVSYIEDLLLGLLILAVLFWLPRGLVPWKRGSMGKASLEGIEE